jgi:hypothetical protein
LELEGYKEVIYQELPHGEFCTGPKYSMSELMGETTALVRHYPLSEMSQQRMRSYPGVSYKFQDGRTHIWMSPELVIKLSFEGIMARHERDILAMNISGLPQLIDSWVSGKEHFMVMTNCGTTLSEEFVFEAALPPEVQIQRNQIKEELRKHDLVHLDDHMANYVIRDGHLTMIDAEVIVCKSDYNALANKVTDHTFMFPPEYYRKISQARMMLGAKWTPLE